MNLWLVAIRDKEMQGEPNVAFAVVDARNEQAAIEAAEPTIELLRDAGRCRCVPHVIGATDQPFKLNHFYRVTLLKPPTDEALRGELLMFERKLVDVEAKLANLATLHQQLQKQMQERVLRPMTEDEVKAALEKGSEERLFAENIKPVRR